MTQVCLDELILGQSHAMQALRDTIRRAAPLGTPVLVQGPTGSGKELVAQGLHVESGRRGPLVPANVAALSESLFESEMFGHVRGAFSGAISSRPGLFRHAAHGTAFLDEIGELSTSAQVKLLRVLDTGEVRPVGADTVCRVDFRLVAATNLDLPLAVAQGRFRADLMYRLRGITVTVPALSEHREDIPALAVHFGRAAAARWAGSELPFTRGAIERLQQHTWPGNVRELRRTIESVAYLADGRVISEQHVITALASSTVSSSYRTQQPQTDPEYVRMQELLREHAGDVTEVARALGVDRSTAYRRIQRLGIIVSRASGMRNERPAPSSDHALIRT